MKTIPRAIAWVILFSAFYCIGEAYATESSVSNAIYHIVTVGIPEHRIKPCPNHPMAQEVSPAREALAQAIVAAAQKHAIPEMLMVAIAFRENSFTPGGVGDIGEVSVFQIVPSNEKPIQRGKFHWTNYKEPECELDTVGGSALCSAALLRIHMFWCDDLPGALMLYATGHTCKPYTKKLRWLQWDRFGIARILKRRFG